MKTKILYHDDMDGRCSAFLVLDFYGEKNRVSERVYEDLRLRRLQNGDASQVECFPMQYGRPLPEIEAGDIVWIVDFSVEPDVMVELLDKCRGESVFWIDHHKTSISKYQDFRHGIWTGKSILGLRRDGTAACELTWEFLYPKSQEAPYFVRLIGDRDVWKWQLDESGDFHAGLLSKDTSPDAEWTWKELMQDSPNHINLSNLVRNGKVIREYNQVQDREYLRKNGFWGIFDGFSCYAVNGHFDSKPFKEVSPKAYIWMTFYFLPDGFWKVGLFSDKVDVSQIAEAYGGGGHTGAAGFQLDMPPPAHRALCILENFEPA